MVGACEVADVLDDGWVVACLLVCMGEVMNRCHAIID